MNANASEAYRFWTEEHVRFADLDPLEHCNNAAISGFFESGRVALLAAAGHPLGQGGTSLALMRMLIEFHRELLYGARVRIGVRVVKLGRSSVTLASAVFNQEHCAATSEGVLVLIDLQTRSSTELPPGLRARLSDYL